ncbi:hypothetical protein EC973_003888 [Apophysomyces ossiformis]|uniref:Uncharacterized protein n=1 Tax=Apophysomyces ossiformis TaxID=679940 RepID=A0A8H7EM36_9FUNG|nr:hypothetical protein EC973_003888 [Apophysomyces ossiformis]
MATYEFEPPPNMAAIRYTIGQRIHKARAETRQQPRLPLVIDSPSLPNATQHQDDPPVSSKDLDRNAILKKIRELQDEKHRLFGLMRTLLAASHKEPEEAEVSSLPLPSPLPKSDSFREATKTEEGEKKKQTTQDA